MSYIIIYVLFLCFIIYLLFLHLRRPDNYPPGPRWLPLVGNTPLLRRLSRQLGAQHLALSYLAKQFKSNVIGLKLGRDLVVVVFTPEVVKEVLLQDEFIGRPDTFFNKLRSFGVRRGITCTDGPLWHEHRSFTLKHLRQLGFGRSVMEDLIQNELTDLLSVLGKESKPQSLNRQLSLSVVNVLWTLAAGRRLDRKDQKLSQLLDLLSLRARAFDMAGGMLSQFPWLRFIAPGKTGYNLLIQFNEHLRDFILETIQEHQLNFQNGETKDLIDVFLQEMENRKDDINSTFTEAQLIMVILDLFIAGGHTTSNTIDFAFLMMVKHPQIQSKVFDEIRKVIGDEKPTMLDKIKMPYTEAVLLECQRINHVTPVTGPRRVLQDTSLGGYTIPKNATVLISSWSVHRDETLFPQPDQFQPERFLDSSGSLVDKDNLILFGLGKRRCLGEALAKSCIFLFFVGILQKFNIVKGTIEEPSLEPLPGISLAPKPYSVLLIPRHVGANGL